MKRITLAVTILSLVVLILLPALAAATPATKINKVLVIPLKFAFNSTSPYPVSIDDIIPLTPELTNTITTQMRSFIEANSYGKATLSFYINPVLTHPVVAPFDPYDALVYPYGISGIENWALANASVNPQDYDAIIFATSFIKGYNKKGSTGGNKIFINGAWEPTVWAHEFGHFLNMGHSQFWSSTNGDIIGNGIVISYGNEFDLMGGPGTGGFTLDTKSQFGIVQKLVAGWLSEGSLGGNQAVVGKQGATDGFVDGGKGTIQAINKNGSGLYRIYAMDSLNPPGAVGLKIDVPSTQVSVPAKQYWIEFRQLLTTYPRLMNGVLVNFTNPCLSYQNCKYGEPKLLDFTPETPGAVNTYNLYAPGVYDSALLIGQTFTDAAKDIHITPIQKNGTNPESIDVMVYRNTQAINHAPTGSLSASKLSVVVNNQVTLTMNANDVDGDRFAYYWQFKNADGTPNTATIAGNAAQITKSWSAAGTYEVRCTASDMKGGTVTKSVSITVTNH